MSFRDTFARIEQNLDQIRSPNLPCRSNQNFYTGHDFKKN